MVVGVIGVVTSCGLCVCGPRSCATANTYKRCQCASRCAMLLHDCGLHRCVDSHLKATSLITLATESAGEQDECVKENPRTRTANDEGVYKHAKTACQPPVRTSNAQHMKQPTVYTTIFVCSHETTVHTHTVATAKPNGMHRPGSQ